MFSIDSPPPHKQPPAPNSNDPYLTYGCYTVFPFAPSPPLSLTPPLTTPRLRPFLTYRDRLAAMEQEAEKRLALERQGHGTYTEISEVDSLETVANLIPPPSSTHAQGSILL